MSLPYFLFLNCKWPKTYTMSFIPIIETEIESDFAESVEQDQTAHMCSLILL